MVQQPPGGQRGRTGRIFFAASTLGILGFGAIGESLAQKALALGINVVALRQSQAPFSAGVEAAKDIHDLFARADHLVVAAPLTEATRNLINRDVLGSAKPGLHLINIARGGLLDQEALLEFIPFVGPLAALVGTVAQRFDQRGIGLGVAGVERHIHDARAEALRAKMLAYR